MTRCSRGISAIQEKARGNDMSSCGMKKGGKADPRKNAPSNVKKRSSKMSMKGSPMDKASLGAIGSAGPMPGYKKGGMIDGCAKKGKTRGKIV